MTSSATTLLEAIEGRPAGRPLLAPLIAALAAEVEELDQRAFLTDAGKRARILADLARSLPIDVLVLDSGSGWDVEAAGLATDWSRGYPPAPRAGGGDARFDPARGGAPVVVDLIGRAKAVVPATIALGVTVTGPATLADAGAGLDLVAAVQQALAAVRTVAQAGAAVVVVREDPAVALDPERYLQATGALWGSLRFFRTAGVLHVRGPADAWAPVLTRPGPFLPCFDPVAAPAVAAALAGEARPFGLVVPATADAAPRHALRDDERCALLIHEDDLAGRVPVRDVRAAVGAMGG